MKFRRKVSLILSMAMLVSAIGYVPSVSADTNSAVLSTEAVDEMAITEAEGWFESAYIKWSKFENAEGYNVYVKQSGASNYSKLDDELVRKYEGYYRADALGLVPGEYIMKVVPIVEGAEVGSAGIESGVLSVKAYVREGFAFSPQSPYTTTNGGYNSDGSIKANADILYLTNDNRDTLTVGGDATKGVGMVNILNYRSQNKTTTPLVIRVLGRVEMPTGVENYMMKFENTQNVTMEGVGDDATIHGWGLTLKRACNTEFRNFAIMWYGGGGDGDSLSLDTENKNSWIHNLDFFYGYGKEADQAKGDGSIDLKARTDYVTIDNNHFWDSGKALVAGGVWEAKNPNAEGADINVTYHHNWFDHSDSRHPRCVAGKVHVYNNYYDGVAKYGVGAAVQSSVFVENNYFRNCPRPMIIATQGSDVYISDGNYDTKGTLSGQTGGMIKEFGNIFVTPKRFVNQNTTPDAGQIDAYSVSSRDEVVPSTVTAMSGGATYNNFDTASTMYSYNVDSTEDVPANVMASAGRMNGGDFKWEFDNSVQDSNSDVIPELQSAIINYKSSLVKVGGSTLDKAEEEPTTGTENTETTTENATGDNETTETTTSEYVGGGSVVHNFTASGTTSSFFTFTGDISNSKGNVEYKGLTLTDCLKVGSTTTIGFTAPADGVVTLVFNAANGKVNIKVNDEKLTGDAVSGLLTFNVTKGTAYLLSKYDTANLYYIDMALSGEGGSTESTTAVASESTTESTTAVASESTTESTTAVTSESTTESTTVATTESTTESTTVATTESTTESTTVATTESTTESTTAVTSETTTENTTVETTESTTEGTTQPTSGVRGPKASVVNGNDMLFVASVDGLNYKEAGFIFEANGKTIKRSITTVYSSINGSEFGLQDLGGKYMFAYNISDIADINAEIKVTAFAVDQYGNEVVSQTFSYSIGGLSAQMLTYAQDVATSDTAVYAEDKKQTAILEGKENEESI